MVILLAAQGDAEERAKLTIGYSTTGPTAVGLWVAKDIGAFDKYGVDLTLVFISSSPVMVPALIGGDFIPLATCGHVLAYERGAAGKRFRIALNMAGREQRFSFDGQWMVAISTMRDRSGDRLSGTVTLRAHEGVVARKN